jgi:hypothetical protein
MRKHGFLREAINSETFQFGSVFSMSINSKSFSMSIAVLNCNARACLVLTIISPRSSSRTNPKQLRKPALSKKKTEFLEVAKFLWDLATSLRPTTLPLTPTHPHTNTAPTWHTSRFSLHLHSLLLSNSHAHRVSTYCTSVVMPQLAPLPSDVLQRRSH